MLLLAESDHSTLTTFSESSVVPTTQHGSTHCTTPGDGQDFPQSLPHTHPAQHYLTSQSGVSGAQHLSRTARHNRQWDINDNTLPVADIYDPFELWSSGHSRRMYRADSDDARRHVSGWAMRNTNNHNALILKKSCLGVLVCSLDCLLESERKVHLRPAICDKARRKQIGQPCPNSRCSGKLTLLSCRGHCGYPVTHFWRHVNSTIYFQAKGHHDHPRPEVKSLTEKGRHMLSKQISQHGSRRMSSPMKRRFPILTAEDIPDRKIRYLAQDEVLCSCPPFECICSKSVHTSSSSPSDLGYPFESPSLSHTFFTHWPPSHTGLGIGNVPQAPFTQINITNTFLPHPSLDANFPNYEINQTNSKCLPHGYNDNKLLGTGNDHVRGQHYQDDVLDKSSPSTLHSPKTLHMPGSSYDQKVNCLPYHYNYGAGTHAHTHPYAGDLQENSSRLRSGHCCIKNENHQAKCNNGSPPCSTTVTDIPTGSNLKRYDHIPDTHYDSSSPDLSSPSLQPSRSENYYRKLDCSSESTIQDENEEGELTYTTLIPAGLGLGEESQRHFHSCRLVHSRTSPEVTVDSVHSTTPVKITRTNWTPPTPLTSSPYHYNHIDISLSTSPPLTSPHHDHINLSGTNSPSLTSQQSPSTMPGLIFNDTTINQPAGSERLTTFHSPVSMYQDRVPGCPLQPSDNQLLDYPAETGGYGQIFGSPYGVYDVPGIQSCRNRSINITLTYN